MKHPFLPAEWHPQDAVMLTWPHEATDWQPILSEVEPAFIAIASAILTQQSLLIVTHDQALQERVKRLLKPAIEQSSFKVFWVIAPTDDTWARDHGPITVINANNSETTCLDFIFNAWGDKFSSAKDDKINQEVFKQLGINRSQRIDFILEGGGIESDGFGTLMTTTTCLLNTNRNQELNQQQIEQQLKQTLGVEQIVWLENGYLCGDDTDSHIDTLARFAPNNQILYVQCDDPQDEHYTVLQRMEQELSQFRNTQGDAYKLVPLPWPSAKFNADGERLPATYANFLIINHCVLVPTYQDSKDQKALAIFEQAFPEHQIVGIDCLKVIEQYGSLHCLTMQLPQGTLSHLIDNNVSR